MFFYIIIHESYHSTSHKIQKIYIQIFVRIIEYTYLSIFKGIFMVKKIVNLLLLCTLLVGLNGCEDDENYYDDLYDDMTYMLCERIWTDSFTANNGAECYQELFFYPNGNGVDHRKYKYRNGRIEIIEDPFYWDWEDRYCETLVIDYGGGIIDYYDDVKLTPNTLRAILNGDIDVRFVGYPY